jgi:CheY-like chemotaxis protein
MADAVRILLIDDNDTFRSIARRMLVNAGYEVHEAANGETALAAYRQQRFDLVITDIVMPDMEGLEAIMKLRRQNPDVKIIAMSGADSAGAYLDSAKIFGARRMLSKPFTQGELLTAVSEVLAS